MFLELFKAGPGSVVHHSVEIFISECNALNVLYFPFLVIVSHQWSVTVLMHLQ